MLLLMPNLEEIPAPEKQLKWDLATSNHVQGTANGVHMESLQTAASAVEKDSRVEREK